jgi:hypothetical protein
MALSRKMLAIVRRVDAARAELFAAIRETNRREARERAAAKSRQAAKKKAALAVSPPC